MFLKYVPWALPFINGIFYECLDDQGGSLPPELPGIENKIPGISSDAGEENMTMVSWRLFWRDYREIIC